MNLQGPINMSKWQGGDLKSTPFRSKGWKDATEREWDIYEVNGPSTDFRVNVSVQYQEKQYYLKKKKHTGENEA